MAKTPDEIVKRILGHDKHSKNKDLTEVRVSSLPSCDFCGNTARYDGKTHQGPWANMCPTCFKKYGVGLGLGRGQLLKDY